MLSNVPVIFSVPVPAGRFKLPSPVMVPEKSRLPPFNKSSWPTVLSEVPAITTLPPSARITPPAALVTLVMVIASPASATIKARLMVLLNEIPIEPPVPAPLPESVSPAPRVVVTAPELLLPTKLLAPANRTVPLPAMVCVLRLTRLELDVRLKVRPAVITKPFASASVPSFNDSVRLAGTTRSMSSNTSVNVLLDVNTRLPTLPLRCSVPPVIVPPCRFTTPVVSLNTKV